ncbi:MULTISPECIES: RNA polymerase sigma-70 factor [Bacteroides]|uniref:RNA polymerase sigma-70 factor n=1 Tax=Bacteroides TaxID=816 RepID=UPI00163BF3AB|nr:MULTISPECIES: RNA polymerase sigma-70 factor [Bacteroides]
MILLFHKNHTKEEAFKQLFTEMYPRLVRYATQLTGDREEARDIVSEAMEQAWKHFDRLDKNDCGGWLYTIVRNTSLNHLKHRMVEQDNLTALYEATQADVESNYKEHEALLQKAEAIAHRLPEPTCTVLRLCYYERLTYREAALRLGISPDTVKKHISKALRILREAMNK